MSNRNALNVVQSTQQAATALHENCFKDCCKIKDQVASHGLGAALGATRPTLQQSQPPIQTPLKDHVGCASTCCVPEATRNGNAAKALEALAAQKKDPAPPLLQQEKQAQPKEAPPQVTPTVVTPTVVAPTVIIAEAVTVTQQPAPTVSTQQAPAPSVTLGVVPVESSLVAAQSVAPQSSIASSTVAAATVQSVSVASNMSTPSALSTTAPSAESSQATAVSTTATTVSSWSSPSPAESSSMSFNAAAPSVASTHGLGSTPATLTESPSQASSTSSFGATATIGSSSTLFSASPSTSSTQSYASIPEPTRTESPSQPSSWSSAPSHSASLQQEQRHTYSYTPSPQSTVTRTQRVAAPPQQSERVHSSVRRDGTAPHASTHRTAVERRPLVSQIPVERQSTRESVSLRTQEQGLPRREASVATRVEPQQRVAAALGGVKVGRDVAQAAIVNSRLDIRVDQAGKSNITDRVEPAISVQQRGAVSQKTQQRTGESLASGITTKAPREGVTRATSSTLERRELRLAILAEKRALLREQPLFRSAQRRSTERAAQSRASDTRARERGVRTEREVERSLNKVISRAVARGIELGMQAAFARFAQGSQSIASKKKKKRIRPLERERGDLSVEGIDEEDLLHRMTQSLGGGGFRVRRER
jgi:hypothetical protein